MKNQNHDFNVMKSTNKYHKTLDCLIVRLISSALSLTHPHSLPILPRDLSRVSRICLSARPLLVVIVDVDRVSRV